MDEWLIQPLASAHLRAEFSCGQPALDDFLHRYVRQYERRKLGRTYVGVRPADEPRVLGYYALASGSVQFRNLPAERSKGLPGHPVPVALLARLAVDRSLHGQGLGRALLMDGLNRARAVSRQLGIHAVEVVALDAPAKAFYQKYGFEPLFDDPLHLFLPLATVEKAFR